MCYLCLTDDTKCEWEKLKPFVEIYNSVNGCKYKLLECLDVFKKDRPHPEFVMQNEKNGQLAVVEHKVVVWPPDHQQKHKSHHYFMERVGSSLGAHLQDSLFVVEVPIKGVEKSKKEIERLVDDITRKAIENKHKIQLGEVVGGDSPIPWSIRRLHEHEMDEEDYLHTGIKVVLSGPWGFNFDPDTLAVETGVSKILRKHLASTSKKFEGYNEHSRIFVTEVYSKDAEADHELVEKLLGQLEVPHNIDEIWVGFPRWTSEYEHVPCYRRIR